MGHRTVRANPPMKPLYSPRGQYILRDFEYFAARLRNSKSARDAQGAPTTGPEAHGAVEPVLPQPTEQGAGGVAEPAPSKTTETSLRSVELAEVVPEGMVWDCSVICAVATAMSAKVAACRRLFRCS